MTAIADPTGAKVGDTNAEGQLQRLVQIAVCPDDHSRLTIGSTALLDRLNDLIAQGSLREKSGTLLKTQVDAVLIRADAALAYPVRDGIAVLLVEAAILLDNDDRALIATSDGKQI